MRDRNAASREPDTPYRERVYPVQHRPEVESRVRNQEVESQRCAQIRKSRDRLLSPDRQDDNADHREEDVRDTGIGEDAQHRLIASLSAGDRNRHPQHPGADGQRGQDAHRRQHEAHDATASAARAHPSRLLWSQRGLERVHRRLLVGPRKNCDYDERYREDDPRREDARPFLDAVEYRGGIVEHVEGIQQVAEQALFGRYWLWCGDAHWVSGEDSAANIRVRALPSDVTRM